MTIGLTAPRQSGPLAQPGRRRGLPRWAIAMITVGIGVFALALTDTLTGQDELASSGTTQAAVGLMLPILLAGLGGLWSERAGIINIGLEGMMILGTWGAAWSGYYGGPWAAIAGGILFGALGGLLHAFATVTFNVNHIISGVAITLLAAGVTQYLSALVFGPITQNPRASPRLEGFDVYSVQPFADWFGDLRQPGYRSSPTWPGC